MADSIVVLIGRDHTSLSEWELNTLQSLCGFNRMGIARQDDPQFGPGSPVFEELKPIAVVIGLEHIEVPADVGEKIAGKNCIAVRAYHAQPATVIFQQFAADSDQGCVLHILD